MRHTNLNKDIQNYRGLPLQIAFRDDYNSKRAKEYYIINKYGHLTTFKIWIPNRYLSDDGTIDEEIDFMWIFKDRKVYEKITMAGYKFKY